MSSRTRGTWSQNRSPSAWGGGAISGSITLSDDVQLILGSGSDAAFEYDTANTPDTLKLGVSSDSNTILICEKADMQTDFNLNPGLANAAYTDPSLVIQSADATKVYQGLLMTHAGVHSRFATTDVAPNKMIVKGGSAATAATGGNLTGGHLDLIPGQGLKVYTIVDWSLLAGKTFTVTVDTGFMPGNSGATVLTEGTSFTAATSNAITATNLAAAINSLVVGAEAQAVASTVIVRSGKSYRTVFLATNAAAGGATATNNTDGNIQLWGGFNGGYFSIANSGMVTFTATSGFTISAAIFALQGLACSTKFSTTTSNIAIANLDTTFAVTTSSHTITQTSGASTIATITGGVSGMELDLYFTNTGVTFTDTAIGAPTATAGQLILNGALVGAIGTMVTLKCLAVGASSALVWVEKSRSANG